MRLQKETVRNRLDRVTGYPQEADEPTLKTAGSEDNAIAWFVVRSLDGTKAPAEYLTFLEDTVKPQLERVEGVAGVNFFGGVAQELHVEFDPDLLLPDPELALADGALKAPGWCQYLLL